MVAEFFAAFNRSISEGELRRRECLHEFVAYRSARAELSVDFERRKSLTTIEARLAPGQGHKCIVKGDQRGVERGSRLINDQEGKQVRPGQAVTHKRRRFDSEGVLHA